MDSWTGKLYVFKDLGGMELISAVNPTTLGIDKLHIRAFQVGGPYMPVGFPKPLRVQDAGKWMEDLRQKGFSLDPCSID